MVVASAFCAAAAALGFHLSVIASALHVPVAIKSSVSAHSASLHQQHLYSNEDGPYCLGERNKAVTCFRPGADTCRQKAQRLAIVNAFDFHEPLDLNSTDCYGHLQVGDYLQNQAHVAKVHGADHIFLVPHGTSLSDLKDADALANLGVIFREVPWLIPPGLQEDFPIESGGCCGAREFMKLHAFNLVEYDAVVFYDTDIRINDHDWPQGALSPLFDCAASGYFLSTPVYSHEPWVNGGFFAVRPDADLFAAMLTALSSAKVDLYKGWNEAGWGPGNDGVGQNQYRMQGFLTYFMYQDGLHKQFVTGRQVDACIWNRQQRMCEECNSRMSPMTTRVFHHSSSDC